MNIRSLGAQPLTAWLCILVLASGAAVFGILPLELARADAAGRAATLHKEARRLSAEMTLIEAAGARRARPDNSLTSVAPAQDDGSATAAMLRALSDVAVDRRVTVVSIVPNASDVTTPQTQSRGLSAGRDYAIAARGHFRDLLAFLETIATRDAVLDVRSADIHAGATTAADRVAPALDATIRVTLYRADSGAP